MRNAKLYLLDEPMGQLEPQLRAMLRGRIKHYLRTHANTTILVTHDQTEANALADRIAVMEDGELQQYATPAELKERPANLFVGAFIGEPPMNVFAARVDGDGDMVRFTSGRRPRRHRLSAERDRPCRCATGSCGPRHRDDRHPSACVADRRWADQGARLSCQWLGDQTHVAAELGAMTVVAVSHERSAPAAGQEIALSIRRERPPPLRRHERRGHRAWRTARMTRDILIGIDAGTSVIKSVAFTLAGEQLAIAATPNSYETLADGGVEQDMARTWADTAATLRLLAEKIAGLCRAGPWRSP